MSRFLVGILLASTICLPLLAQFQIVKQTPERITLQFQADTLFLDAVDMEGTTYTRVSYTNHYFSSEPGAPLLPYSRTKIAIPEGANVTVQYKIVDQETFDSMDLLPQAIVSGRRGTQSIPIRREIYDSALPYPGKIVEVSPPRAFHYLETVDLNVFPIQYSPAQHQVQWIKKMLIDLLISSPQKKSFSTAPAKLNTKILSQKILNFEQARNWTAGKPAEFSSLQVNYDFSSGQWYKIPVSQEGIYAITGSFLKDQGIDISSISTATIQMFNYGGAPLSYSVADPRPEDLNEIAIEVEDKNSNGILDETDRILFYGKGTSGWQYKPSRARWVSYFHPYATTNYYIFTFNQNMGKRIQSRNSEQTANPLQPNAFTDFYRFEEDRYNILQSGLDWYWVKLEGTFEEKTLDFSLPQNLAPGPMDVYFYFKGKGGSRYGDNKNYRDTIDVFLNGQLLINNVTLYRNQWKPATYTSSQLNYLQGGQNQLRFVHTANLEGAGAFLDFFTVSFQRPFVAENNYLKFYYIVDPNTVEFRISGLSGNNNTVWDVTDFANAQKIVPLSEGNPLIFQDRSAQAIPRQYVAFSAGGEKLVQQIIPIENSPNLRDPSRKGTFLIITHEDFYQEAEVLETMEETRIPNPLETERVRVRDIYREFSSCVPDPTAIRDFLRYAYFNWSSPPQYVLLLGDGSYDYKNVELNTYINRVPLFEIAGPEEVSSRESDHFYVDFGNTSPSSQPDQFDPYPGFTYLDPWVAIGRVPVNNLNELEIFLEKEAKYRESYKLNPQENGWQTVMTFVSDDEFGPVGFENEWFHLRDTERLLNLYVPKKFDRKKIYLTDYETQAGGLGRIKPAATEDFLNQLNRGTLMINFYGHGDPDTWAHEQLLVRSRDLPRIQNEDKLPFWIAATCDWGKFDDPNQNSMAEEMIWLPDKGGIGVLSSSRPVYASANAAFVERFYRNLFPTINNSLRSYPVGDALVISLGGGQNDQKYRLLGNPTLRLADPQYQVTITSVSPDTLKALSTVSLSARVTDDLGNSLTTFNGDALVRVFDVVDSMSAANGSIKYLYQDNLIFKGIVSVQNGELEAKFIVPKSIKYKNSPTGRISIYAWDEDLRDAAGYVDTLLINGSERDVADNAGPEIEFSFTDQPNFVEGDYVSRQPTIVVRLFDEQGINITREVGHRIELTIDNQVEKDVTEFFVYDKNSFQSGELKYTLPPLSPGLHTLKISAWDNLNNFSEQEVTFRTSSQENLVLDEVMNYPNPFARDTYFTFQFQSPGGVGEVKIKIYTVTGRLIQELEGFAQPGFNRIYWDGRDRDGDILANGVYLYKIIVDDGEKSVEKIEKLAILR